MHTYVSLRKDLENLGIPQDGTLLIHSSMKSIGDVEGRADTVLDVFMDYFQEAILRINSKINSSYNYNGEGSLFRWMSTVTVNRILDNLRKQNKLKEIRLEDTGIDMSEDVIDVPEDIPLEDILKMVEELSPAKRTVFNLFIDGFSYKEIAQILRITEYGASSTMSKARKELSMKIDEYYRTK